MYRRYLDQLNTQTAQLISEQQQITQKTKMAEVEFKKVPVADLWEKLSKAEGCKSLLKKHLTKERYDALKDLKTSIGGDLGDCIQSGCNNLDSGVGIYACDPEGYDTFAPVLDAVIMDYHKVAKVEHPEPFFGDMSKLDLGNLDPEGNMIVSTRVRVGRSHAGFPFPPSATKQQRVDMEKKTVAALATLEGDLKGKYFSLETMSKEEEDQLIADHFLFKNDDRFLRDAGGYNHWPVGRGIYFSNDKKFLTWINEEDHLRFISMQMGGDLGAVYKRLVSALETLSKKLDFAHNKKCGFVTFCPTNLGTTCRASVHIKVPKLAAAKSTKGNKCLLDDICAENNLQPRGIHGEHTESVGGVYDISNKRRLGLSEYDAIMEMKNGILKIMAAEKAL
ncbi:arginine kinase-like [Mizuhopecten yessoensis]|uniref:Arginine kinase n=1 Tax=Mizuhopecten yessoensis TaxID=6573 RepID=A0A210PM50_MIZYE|nr:arginine kinase-like [Mizuhopecten yessoensis]OWF37578.1 Arginine kinase [Mizuhopecten yessoensis]